MFLWRKQAGISRSPKRKLGCAQEVDPRSKPFEPLLSRQRMPVPPRSLFVLHRDADLRERIARAVGPEEGVELAVVDSWKTLDEALEAATPPSLAVVDARHGSEEGPAPELRELLHAHPLAAVVVVPPPRVPEDLLTLGSWGVSETLVGEANDPYTLRRFLLRARGRPLRVLVERVLSSPPTGRRRTLLRAAAETAAAGGAAEEMGRYLHASSSTLLRQCKSAGLPPPRILLVWMRILLAAQLLEATGSSVEVVSAACGYASDSALRRAFMKYAGMSPREARAEGAVAVVGRVFEEALRRVREERRRPVGR